MINPAISDLRKDYRLAALSEHDVASHPIQQFEKWWNDAITGEVDEANAMTLATATSHGLPSARIVLLKSFDENGFVFFTNYDSKKGQELAQNSHACLLFFWRELERQVRIEGIVQKVAEADSDTYYNSRPIGSRIGAIASPQSKVIPNREFLEAAVEKVEQQYTQSSPVRPANWGGYIVQPNLMEFWQGRSSRLHDRIQYTKDNSNNWNIVRLAP
ncbi:pyridoxamine 5'-phosphate oxidase [Chitinophaga skermanii]|uniref:Pyridoxine/pyridoxamine 5'-phosphate oxidase n=1 Tax=Chitinophaga skermanii TaxID=331697 RepID=A0A327Q0P4_9BACT|nr:pyridoxamine 5'-phosphate oxidase [Chitinophaga skermanii]RAI97464.1 pyridoxamine 5'-phosphate oxidase [Chitinophaga skermanii]